jgi:hypothetical protein
MLLPFGEAAKRILDDDDRTVDDQPEVERAQTHQVARHAQPVHAGAVINMVIGMTAAVMSAARILPSSRNSTTMTSSAPSVRFFSTVDRRVDELGAVIDRLGEHVGRQRLVDLRQLLGARSRRYGCCRPPASARSR